MNRKTLNIILKVLVAVWIAASVVALVVLFRRGNVLRDMDVVVRLCVFLICSFVLGASIFRSDCSDEC